MPDHVEVTARLRAFYDGELSDRRHRPLGPQRTALVEEFVVEAWCRGVRSVLEVGCGAGRDGQVIAAAGFEYTGLDVTPEGVRICADLGLDAVVGDATDLPFVVDRFDAAWTMSTLMHLPGDGFGLALAELRRVVRPGGLLEVGLWGAAERRERTGPDGRLFLDRTDDEVREALAAVGEVVAMDVSWRHPDGGHYQWARVVVA